VGLEKAIHQELVSEIQWIKVEINIPTKLYPDVLKDIKNVPINIEEIQKQDWQVLPYHEMSK
jgi:thiazole synthase ThiGH ThiG subunit